VLYRVWSRTQEPAAEPGAAIGSIEVGASETRLRNEFDITALASSVAGSELLGTAGVIAVSVASVDAGISEVQTKGELDFAAPTPWVMEW
jgi:hypothetical protein